MDMGRSDSRNQVSQSNLRPDGLQAFLLSSHCSQQIDGASALPRHPISLPDYRPHHHRSRHRHLRRPPGRPPHPNPFFSIGVQNRPILITDEGGIDTGIGDYRYICSETALVALD